MPYTAQQVREMAAWCGSEAQRPYFSDRRVIAMLCEYADRLEHDGMVYAAMTDTKIKAMYEPLDDKYREEGRREVIARAYEIAAILADGKSDETQGAVKRLAAWLEDTDWAALRETTPTP